jgi:hypothetical protein
LLTLNQIHAQIVALANAHYQIAEVGMGTIAELQGKPDRSYPLLWLSNEGGSLEDNYKVDNIRLTMFGRVIAGEEGQDDDASEIEVLSDMQLILLDFLNYFHQQHGQEYVTDKAAQLEHFTERTNDRTAGYSCVLELKQFYDWDKCSIPQSGASIPPSVDGLTLYDFCDQATIDRLTLTQIACLEAEFGNCADATVENSDASYSTTVASGGTLVIPDTAISANGDLVLNQPSTIAKDITVRYDTQGTVATTISGGEIVVPDVAAVPSLTIGVFSDAGYTTPVTGGAFGDTVYIKLYESNITPTGFTISFNGGSDKVINQAGGTYTWVIDVKGTVTINASARDGSDGVANATAFTFTTTNAYVGGKELSLDGVADTADGCINGFQIMQNYGLSFMIRKPSGLSASYRGVIGFGSCLAGSTIQRTYNGIVVNHWVQSISYAATFNGQVFNASLSLDLDQDQHWRYEVGETHLRVYKDGVEVYSTARTTALPIISGEISVGISRNTATKPSQMFIRDVFIDDGTLSAAESLALSNASHAGTDPTAAAATKFIEGWDFGRVSTGVPSTNTASPTIAYGMLKNSELVMATTFTSPNGILDL